MHTIVEQLGFFVEGCHISPVEDIIRLLGMEPTNLGDGVIGAPSINDLPFYIESSLLLLQLPNISTQSCSIFVLWIVTICSMFVVSFGKVCSATNKVSMSLPDVTVA